MAKEEIVTVKMDLVRAGRCANIACPNKPGEGQFCFVAIGSIRLFLCVPCGKALTSLLIAGSAKEG